MTSVFNPPCFPLSKIATAVTLLAGMNVVSSTAYAESSKKTAAKEYSIEAQANKNAQTTPNTEKDSWEKSRLTKLKQNAPAAAPVSINELLNSHKITLPSFPSAGKERSDASDFIKHPLLALAEPVINWVFPSAHAATLPPGGITIDGNLSDWTANDRINLPLDRPPYLATGAEIYGKYSDGNYIFALKSTSPTISGKTTLYLNTDQNLSTGSATTPGGVDYFVNIDPSDKLPYLYGKDFNLLQRLSSFAFSVDHSVLEFSIPATLFTTLSASNAINVFADINDASFTPEYFDGVTEFTLNPVSEVLPTRTDLSKRVGIVYSTPTKNNFYNEKAYSQLFMSLQHQAMMAGISFDLLSENDLSNLNKLVNYDALIFPFADNISNSARPAIRKTLYQAIYKYGIGIITADNWLTNDEANQPIAGDSYQIMKQLLGITRNNGVGPAQITVNAADITHPAMKSYSANEGIISYPAGYTSYFQAIPGQSISVLANQNIAGVGTVPAVIANTTGGRNVHFASTNLLGDTALAWQAIQWVVYGNTTPAVALKMGRHNNLFISRNDMDQAQEHDELTANDVALYPLLQNWKTKYNFVGSYYIDIGNNPTNGQWTDWSVSAPLYKKYLALDNEIGTHSWTHPFDTNLLTPTQVEFEFNQSMNQISQQLGPTWRAQNIRGSAVPGMPETLSTATGISQYLGYLSGGWSSIGAGYPNAIGYLTPDATKPYFSPNMTFDFTLIEFGVLPKNQYGVPTSTNVASITKLTNTEASTYWNTEFDRLMKHASQPIIHWPWHDYGPTDGSNLRSTFCKEILTNGSKSCYSTAMFENTIAYAKNNNSEFATVSDVAQRMDTFRQAKMSVTPTATGVSVNVASNNVGKFSLAPNLPAGKVIQNVSNWYAYNDKQVFLGDTGGSYTIQIGSAIDTVSHITALPMRARLLNVTGNGNALSFSFEGEGTVTVALSAAAADYWVTSDNGTLSKNSNTRSITFNSFGVHTVDIKPGLPTGSFTAQASAMHSGLCMSVSNGSTLALSAVVQQNCTGASYQKLIFTPVVNKPAVYTLKFSHSGQCADVNGGSQLNGAALIQYPCGTGSNQQFKLVDAGNGSYNLIAQHSAKLLDVYGASLSAGAKVVQWASTGGNNQKWRLSQL